MEEHKELSSVTWKNIEDIWHDLFYNEKRTCPTTKDKKLTKNDRRILRQAVKAEAKSKNKNY